MSDITQGNSSTPRLVKCDHADVCDRGDNRDCPHSLSHQYIPSCNAPCRASSFKGAHCIPVNDVTDIPAKDYVRALEGDVARLLRERARITNEAQDYKSIWLRLRCELQLMQSKGARHLDPVFLMRFMDYLETVEESE